MAHISTEHITQHTLTLTPDELQALRRAAKAALDTKPDSKDAETWHAFTNLEKPATRSRASFIAAHSNPSMIGTDPTS
ncbi:hypothetical protein [Streptomyces sp. NPDC056987]|uniref:hypothetical protein n=1 Tax=Streptomyces sp. NPDC056987 TaxID=3345988 RepID=UPI00362B48DB